MNKVSRAIIVLAATIAPLIFIGAPANAAPITVLNPSFEADVVANGAFTIGVINSWTAPTSAGVFDPNGQITPSHLEQTAYSNSGTIAQVLTGNVLTFGNVYTLLVDVGDRNDTVVPVYTVGLYAGGLLLAQDNNTLDPVNGFLTSTVLFTPLASDPRLGQTLEIRLFSNDVQTNFDNVRLDATSTAAVAVPEPASLALVGLGLVAFGVTRRRKKR